MAHMTHRQKVKLAKRFQTHDELIQGVSIFNTQRWNMRKLAILKRTMKMQLIAHYYAEQWKARRRRDRENMHQMPQTEAHQ